MRVGPDGDAERAREAEVGELEEVVALVDEQVLRLEVPVQDAVLVAEADPVEHLVQVELDEGVVLLEVGVGVHEPLQVHVQVLEDQVEFLARVHHVEQRHDAPVAQLLEQRNLADGSRRHALLLVVEADLLESVCGRG